MKFRQNLAVKILSIMAAVSVLASCGSAPSKVSSKNNSSLPRTATGDDPQKFGAKYSGRTYQQAILSPVASVENKGAVVNQGDFLTQLTNVRDYSNSLTNRFAANYGKITNWVLAGANVNELAQYGINPQIMKGFDGYQNVLMTGYYSPVIHARRTAQGQYQHPIYAMPSYKRYSRAGQNGYKYQAVGRLLVEDGEIPKEKMSIQAIREWGKANPSRVRELLERNPSYVFFKNDPTGEVKGSAGVPLVPMAAVASDRNVIPSGTVLLVEVPDIDNDGNWMGTHKLHLMVALDVGGAVNGHHFDLYRGIGDQAGHIAGLSKHYGRVWVLQ